MMAKRFYQSHAPMRVDTRPILPQSREDACLMEHMRERVRERLARRQP